MVESEYAKAVYELAVEENKVDLFLECFNAINETLNDEFLNILSSPFITKDDKKEMIKKVYLSLDGTFLNFLNVIIDHNRFTLMKDIRREYETLVLSNKNILRLNVKSAKKLTSNQMEKLTQTLSLKYPGKTIEIKNEVKPELIGGIEIESSIEKLDASVLGTLNKLKESL